MLKIGDKIRIFDTSYSFGIREGEYSEPMYSLKKEILTVIATGLFVARKPLSGKFGDKCTIADILVTDNNGNYWFIQSERVKRISPEHTITIDDKEITISDESFQALKKQLI